MIGKKTIVKQGKNAHKQWKMYMEEGFNDVLQSHPDRISPLGNCIGWMDDYIIDSKSFTEMPRVFMRADCDVPTGFDLIDIPQCTMAVLWITDTQPNLEKGAHNALLKRLKKTDFEADYRLGFSAEYYSNIGYVNLDPHNPYYKFGYLLPCKLKTTE